MSGRHHLFKRRSQHVSFQRRFVYEVLSELQRVMTEPWVDLEGDESLKSHNGSGADHRSAPLAALPKSRVEVDRERYPSWSRRRVRYAVSALLPASAMAFSYASRDFWLQPSRRSMSAWVAW
jgi:hypothetical protein